MQYYCLEFLEYDRFYAMCDYVDFKLDFSQKEYCPQCGHTITECVWMPPYKIILSKPLFGDMMYVGSSRLIVSEKFKEAYEKEGLTGIVEFCTLSEVGVKRNAKKQLVPPTYYYAKTKRALATYDTATMKYENNSKYAEKYAQDNCYCPLCRPLKGYSMIDCMRYGYDLKFLNEDDKKLDIFRTYPFRWGDHFSQRVVDIAKKYDLKNVVNKLIKTQDSIVFPATIGGYAYYEKMIIDRLKRGEEY